MMKELTSRMQRRKSSRKENNRANNPMKNAFAFSCQFSNHSPTNSLFIFLRSKHIRKLHMTRTNRHPHAIILLRTRHHFQFAPLSQWNMSEGAHLPKEEECYGSNPRFFPFPFGLSQAIFLGRLPLSIPHFNILTPPPKSVTAIPGQTWMAFILMS
jgi:hypothetical protein